MFKKRGQGQSWSLDIIIAFVIFVLIIGIFYALLSNNKQNKADDIVLESNTIVSNIDTSNNQQESTLTFIDKGNVDDIKLEELYSTDYLELKKQFGIKGDFCIYIVDQYGNLITISNGTDQRGSFGNGNFTINDKPCGSTFP